MAGSAGRIYLDVDISDAKTKIDALRAVHTEHEMHQLLYRAFKRTGGHVRKILKTDIPKYYNAAPSWIGSNVMNARTTIGGGGIGVSCAIPIVGERGTIGRRFRANGGAPGWSNVGRPYRIKARIVKGQTSTLPRSMSSQGGQPPFRNTSAPSLHGVTFTRKSKERTAPITPVVGLAVPQMPLNRAEDDVQEDIMDTLMERLDHEHAYIISKCR